MDVAAQLVVNIYFKTINKYWKIIKVAILRCKLHWVLILIMKKVLRVLEDEEENSGETRSS